MFSPEYIFVFTVVGRQSLIDVLKRHYKAKFAGEYLNGFSSALFNVSDFSLLFNVFFFFLQEAKNIDSNILPFLKKQTISFI